MTHPLGGTSKLFFLDKWRRLKHPAALRVCDSKYLVEIFPKPPFRSCVCPAPPLLLWRISAQKPAAGVVIYCVQVYSIVLIRGTIVNRIYGIHKNLPSIRSTIFTNKIWSYHLWSPVRQCEHTVVVVTVLPRYTIFGVHGGFWPLPPPVI